MRKIVFAIFIMCCFNSFAQESGITGVVTYLFNQYQGDKPDIGAKVYVVDSISNPEFKFKIIDDFSWAEIYVSLLNLANSRRESAEQNLIKYGAKKRFADLITEEKRKKEESEKDLDLYTKKLVKFNAETNEKYLILKRNAVDIIRDALSKESVISRSVDGNGTYSIPLKEGVYYVILRSKNRVKDNEFHIFGETHVYKVHVKQNQFKDVSYNFK
jgi:hypothetical protein